MKTTTSKTISAPTSAGNRPRPGGRVEDQPAAPPANHTDDDAEIRYSLTVLGEAVVSERRGRRFRGFGPCQTGRSNGRFAH
jgi:hypothetical protein